MRRSLIAMLSIGLAGFVLSEVPTAQASPVRVAAAPCVVRTQDVPLAHRLDDTEKVGAADLNALPQLPANARAAATSLPAHVTVPVYVHVVNGTRNGERNIAGPKRVKRMIAVLNAGFAGKEHTGAVVTRFRFKLKAIDYTRREGWYHAYLFGPRDLRMKRALHRGNRRDLNIYLNGGGTKQAPVLGWTTFPWKAKSHPRLDSVSVNWKAMPWGTLKHYSQGDTVVHETGHWLGLFHTFQNGCNPPGDEVADTPYEASPSYFCETGRDTCSAPGLDPIHNFMDYSYDSCMYTFSHGQSLRMDRAYARYRQ